MPPKNILGVVEYKQNLAADVWMIRIGLEEEAHFVAGQYVSIKVNDEGLRRSYSIACRPGKKQIDLLVDVSPMGVGSKYILSLGVGDTVEMLGFLGHFTIDENLLESSKQVLFVATGTGIVPFLSMINDLLCDKSYGGEVRLVWGMRHEEDLYWLKEIDNIKRDHDNFHFDLVLSQPMAEWPGMKGHVGDVVEKLSLYPKSMLVYLCGATAMIEEMGNLLNSKGVPREKIFFEKYS